MTDAQLRRFLLYAASAAAATAIAYLALRYLLSWLLPFLLAAAFAAWMEPAVRWMQRRIGVTRGFASLVMTLFLLFALGGLASLLGTALTREARALLERLPTLLAALPDAAAALSARLERYSASAPPWLRNAVEDALARYAAGAGELLRALTLRLPSLLGGAAAALPRLFLAAATTVLAVYFTSSSLPELRELARDRIGAETRQRLLRLRGGFTQSLTRWLRAELTLCAVTFAEVLAGLLLLRRPYALLLALLTTLVDALPVFGAGTVLVPWAAAELLAQNAPTAAALFILYLVTLTVRSALEPRLLGAQAGLPPVLSLLAMYLGFRALGVTGMVLCPFLLLLGAMTRQNRRKGDG